MIENKKRVLLVEASSRQVLPMAKAFFKLGYEVTTLNDSKFDLGYATKYADKKIVVDNIDTDDKIATNTIFSLIKGKYFNLVVPLSDFTAEILAKNKKVWSRYTALAVNDYDIFMKAYDKVQTMKICMEEEIPCPLTLFEIDPLKNYNFPMVVKPKSSCGSIGFHIVNDVTEMENQMNNTQYGEMFAQDYIPQTDKQYNVHIFMDRNSEVKTALVTEKCRWFPIDGGASTLCRTVKADDVLNTCIRFLKKINWVGYCDVDLLMDPRDGIAKIIEINARISANIKICYAAGFNIAKQIMECYSNENVIGKQGYIEDIRLRCLHTDLLWLLKSPDRFHSEPSWFSNKNTIDQIFDKEDVLPWFFFSLRSVQKYKREMKKRKR